MVFYMLLLKKNLKIHVICDEDDGVISRGTERDFSNVVIESNIFFKSLSDSVMSTDFFFLWFKFLRQSIFVG